MRKSSLRLAILTTTGIVFLSLLLPTAARANSLSLGYKSFHPAISSPFYPGLRDEKDDGGIKKLWDIAQPKLDLHGAEMIYAVDRWHIGLTLLGGSESGQLHAVTLSLSEFLTTMSLRYRWQKRMAANIDLFVDPGAALGLGFQSILFGYESPSPLHTNIWLDAGVEAGIRIPLVDILSLEPWLGLGLQLPMVENYKYSGSVDFGWWNMGAGLRVVFDLGKPSEGVQLAAPPTPAVTAKPAPQTPPKGVQESGAVSGSVPGTEPGSKTGSVSDAPVVPVPAPAVGKKPPAPRPVSPEYAPTPDASGAEQKAP